MKTFPSWRAVGRAMQWARQQNGVEVTTRRFPLPGDSPGYTVHTWTNAAADASVTIGHDPIGGADFTGRNGDARRDEIGMTVAEALDMLTSLGLIPDELAERGKRYGRCETCGRVAEWCEPTAQFAGRWCHLWPERPFHVPVISEPEVQPQTSGQATGSICRCSWLGIGTPEHERSGLCLPEVKR